MYSDNIKFNITTKLFTTPNTVSAKFFVLFAIVMALLFLIPSISHADGLFDFQMKLAKKGNAEAQYKVGEMYETGFGVKQDMSESEIWITKSANQGHENAGYKLLYWDVKKNGVNASNKADVTNLNTQAKEGNPQAQYYVGKMHANGVGVKKSLDKAISWLNKAAFVGVLEAERELVLVREDKQRQILAKRRADEKRRAELKAKQERDRQARLEQQRKLQEQKQAEAKVRSEEIARQNKAAAAASAAQQADASKSAEQAKVLAQQKAAQAKKREAQKQALLKQREADEKRRKAKFESDPCSGKSARFLSTCR